MNANQIHKRAWLAIFKLEPTTPNMSQLVGLRNIRPSIVAVNFVWLKYCYCLAGRKYIKTGLNWVDVFVADLMKCRYQRSKGALVIAMFYMGYISELSELSLSVKEQMSPAQPKKMKQRQKNEPSNECKTDESPNTTRPNSRCPPLHHTTPQKQQNGI